MFDVRRLRLLYELSFRGTITATAEALGYTASAVSQQLSALEREAGVPLLERDGRHVVLTPAAHRLVARTRRIIDELEAAGNEIHAGRNTVDGEVRIGTFPSAAIALVIPVVTAVIGRHPQISPIVRETDPDEGIRLLRSGALDILVAYEYDLVTPTAVGGMERIPLIDDPLLVGLPDTHNLASRASVALLELVDELWVAGLPSTTFGEVVQSACRAAGFEPRVGHMAREFAVQEQLVAAGVGVALLPRLACSSPRPGVTYLPTRAPGLTRHIYGLVRQSAQQRPAIRALVVEMIKYCTTLADNDHNYPQGAQSPLRELEGASRSSINPTQPT